MNDKVIKKIVTLSLMMTGVLAIFLGGYFLKKEKNSNIIEYADEKIQEQEKLESASTEIGKNIDENKISSIEDFVFEENDDLAEISQMDENTNLVSVYEDKNKTEENLKENNVIQKEDSKKVNANEKTNVSTTKKLEFERPINGKILKKFAQENLVFSDTLQEWIVHNGIDIKADKTTVVKSAEDGTVYAIKNDPRYGLTVIINHDNEYQTVYANLLTAEFVVEGEKVTKGQTIGTVGNSAAFEVSDEYHLHFEILKNAEYVDPESLIKFE